MRPRTKSVLLSWARLEWLVDTLFATRSKPRRCQCDFHWAQKPRHLAPQAETGSASKLRGLLRSRGEALESGRGGLLPGHIYWISPGRGASHHNRGLHNRVRTSSPPRQPPRGILLLKRKRRGPNRTKQASLRAL